MNKFSKTINKLKAKNKRRNDILDVTPEWVSSRLRELNLDRSEMMNALQLDKSTFSLIMSGKRSMTKAMKGAFYYYLAYMEVSEK